ncbi:hypothetical protein GQ53DRAFT_841917 [Thozetella sp. PMI_491]|nr:hypothetical protein GQ53DRAFT_841917 [Thozetella sp. PMI_491]
MASNSRMAAPSEPVHDVGEGSSSANARRHQQARTLADAMRAPSTTRPEVVVLDVMPEASEHKEVLDPKEDLWLSTADGRYSSPMIPLLVGSEALRSEDEEEQQHMGSYEETFYVHKHILLKSEYFKKALNGDFRESECQRIELPEEDPAIFHFLIAYLYEEKYDPIKPAAAALATPEVDKGKMRDTGAAAGVESDSDASVDSYGSDVSAISRRRRERYRRREERRWERQRQKHPGVHRPNCNCPQCLVASGPPCWHCQAPRAPPPPAPMPHHPVVIIDRDVHYRGPVERPRRRHRYRHGVPEPPLAPPPPGWANPIDPNGGGRIAGEDLRTWLLAYELHLDVYILANKFLLDGFKRAVARVAVDMLETAGADAAVPRVLVLCKKLYEGLSENDPLLKMIFARVGFLQPWRREPESTNRFLVANPDVAAILLREMAARREEDHNGRLLPSMERSPSLVGPHGLGEPLSPYRGGPMLWRGPLR